MELKGLVSGRTHNQRGFMVQVSVFNPRGEQLGNIIVEVPTKVEYDRAIEGLEVPVVIGFGTIVSEIEVVENG